jgi:S1-C subfamily serine protease
MVVKNILKIIAIFIIGIVGGIFADQILWPYFIERPLFYKYRLEQSPVYINETKEITIQENTALQEAIKKVDKVVVGIRAKTTAGKIIEGSGIVVTSDGLVLTLNSLAPQGAEMSLFLDAKKYTPKVLQRKNSLALLKIEENNLATTAFADFEKISLGERVFLLGIIFGKNDSTQKITNEGIIKAFDETSIQTNIIEDSTLQGSPLFDIEGHLVGLNTIDKTGKVSAISIKTIREFLGF